jgi:hypothetical protein
VDEQILERGDIRLFTANPDFRAASPLRCLFALITKHFVISFAVGEKVAFLPCQVSVFFSALQGENNDL